LPDPDASMVVYMSVCSLRRHSETTARPTTATGSSIDCERPSSCDRHDDRHGNASHTTAAVARQLAAGVLTLTKMPPMTTPTHASATIHITRLPCSFAAESMP
jgi:hypothetical protein